MNQLRKLYIETSDINLNNALVKVISNEVKGNKEKNAGTRLVFLDDINEKNPINEPWVGVISAPSYTGYMPIETMVLSTFWTESRRFCLGLYVFSQVQKDILRSCYVKKPIAIVPWVNSYFPDRFKLTNKNTNIFYVGGSLDKIDLFQNNNPDFTITALITQNEDIVDLSKHKFKVIRSLDEDAYQSYIKNSIVIIDEHEDQRGFSIINDCISHCNPVVLSNRSAFKKLLGHQYPLFYNYSDEIKLFLNDIEYLQKAQVHLQSIMERRTSSFLNFANSIESSAIYRTAPFKNSVSQILHQYDISIVINLTRETPIDVAELVVKSLIQQKFNGTFELIIWNSSSHLAGDISKIYAKYKDVLDLKVVESINDVYSNHFVDSLCSLVRSPYIMYLSECIQSSPNNLNKFWSIIKNSKRDVIFHVETTDFVNEKSADYHTVVIQPDEIKNTVESGVFLFQNKHLKRSLLFDNPQIKTKRDEGSGFLHVFFKYMKLPLVRLRLSDSFKGNSSSIY